MVWNLGVGVSSISEVVALEECGGGRLDADDARTCTFGENGAQRHPPSKNLLKTRDHSTPDEHGP